MVVLKNCRFIKSLTEGYEKEAGHVLIAGKEIVGITDDPDFPPQARVVDCGGKTVMPAFIELHAHLYSFLFDESKVSQLTDGEVLFNTYQFAGAYLDAGYTTVRDCGSTRNSVSEVKKAVAAGIVEGPRLLGCGLILTPTERGNESFPDLYEEADGAEEMRKACRVQLQKGNDFVKLMVSGAFLNEGGEPGQMIVTAAEICACVEIASLKNTYVAAHCHSAESVKEAIRAGVRTIEHGIFIDDEGIELLKQRKDCYLVPTAAITEYCMQNQASFSEDIRQKTLRYYEIERERMHQAYQAGLRLGFGSDLDYEAFTSQTGFEFTARKACYGFSELDILQQATIQSAEILGLADRLGTVAVGKLADLVVLDGRPDEDINVLKTLPAMVLKEGEILRHRV